MLQDELVESAAEEDASAAITELLEGVDSWTDFGASCFWILVVLTGTCSTHLAVVWAVRRKGWEVPALLVFPRIELIIGTSAVPGATRASVVLISTGHPGGIVLGLLVLLSFPLAILAFVFTTLRRGILAKGSVVRWVPNTDKPTVGGCKLNSFV